MNIFAKIIITTKNELKNEIIQRLSLNLKEKINNLEIFTKTNIDESIVLIFGENKDFENIFNYAKDNYEILKIINLWNSIALDDLDLKPWDIMIPNTIINEKNEAIFFDYLIDKNYDLKNFGLILNWICLTKENKFKNKNEVLDLKEEYFAEILDDESFLLARELEKNDLIKKSIVVKIVWNSPEFDKNWIDILELIL